MLHYLILCIVIKSAHFNHIQSQYGFKYDNNDIHSKLLKVTDNSYNEVERTNENISKIADTIDQSLLMKLAKQMSISEPRSIYYKGEHLAIVKSDDDPITKLFENILKTKETLNNDLGQSSDINKLWNVQAEQLLQRNKRELNNATAAGFSGVNNGAAAINSYNINELNNSSGVMKENSATRQNNTESGNKTVKQNNSNAINENSGASLNKNKDNSNYLQSDGRKYFEVNVPSWRANEESLVLLQSIINEIEKKLYSLTNVKRALSANNSYRIGYIIANIDTLYMTLKKLTTQMQLDVNILDKEKINSLLHRVKVTDAVVTNLLNELNFYLPSAAA